MDMRLTEAIGGNTNMDTREADTSLHIQSIYSSAYLYFLAVFCPLNLIPAPIIAVTSHDESQFAVVGKSIPLMVFIHFARNNPFISLWHISQALFPRPADVRYVVWS